MTYHQLLLDRRVSDSAALAWAAHDLGIWTAGTFDYLEPSADLASLHAPEFGITDIEHVRRMITEHHKLRTTSDPVVEAFRMADLIDVSYGLVPGGIGRSRVKAVVGELPYLGFHAFLAKGLTGHAVRRPLRPLPMLRW